MDLSCWKRPYSSPCTQSPLTERKQSFDVAVATYHAMAQTYRMYDYQLIELPCVSVEERVDFILSRIVH